MWARSVLTSASSVACASFRYWTSLSSDLLMGGGSWARRLPRPFPTRPWPETDAVRRARARRSALRVHPLARHVAMLLGDDRDVVERLAAHREAVAVPALLAPLEHALLEHAANQASERALLLREEAIADVERDPAVVGDQVERLGEGLRRDVAEAERRHGHERVELALAEVTPDVRGERGQVDRVVGVVDARAVALGGHLGLLDDVDAHEGAHAELALELLADHPVPCAHVEHAQVGAVVAGQRELVLEQPAHGSRGVALELVVEDLLVEAGD